MSESWSMQNAIDYLYSFINYEASSEAKYDSVNYDLESFRSVLARVGNPQLSRPAVHIAGTKGKGAVAAIINAILHSSGYSTGLYTSPHLCNIRERIRLNGIGICESDFIRYAREIYTIHQQSIPERGYRTTFETLTAMAFLFFRDRNVDFSILETGMGGRLDCTNVVIPDISVITPVSRDHMESLGSQITEIAGEKAGIVKQGIPVICSFQEPAALQVIKAKATLENAPLIYIPRNVQYTLRQSDLEGSRFSMRYNDRVFHDLFLTIPGVFQVENAVTAITAVLELARLRGLELNEDCIRSGLRKICWHGRFSPFPSENLLSQPPMILIADGGHNPDAMEKLVLTLDRIFRDKRICFVVGIAKNKEAREMLRIISPRAHRLVITQYSNVRSSKADDLFNIAKTYHGSPEKSRNLRHAFEIINSGPQGEEVIVVTGSIYLAGELYNLAGFPDLSLNIFRADPVGIG